MEAICFRTHKTSERITELLNKINSQKDNVFVVHDATDREGYPEDCGAPVFNFTADQYLTSGYVIPERDKRDPLLDATPPTPPKNSRSRICYFNPEIAQLLFWRKYPDYDYYWYLESDVAYTGNWNTFFDTCIQYDADILALFLKQGPKHNLYRYFKYTMNYHVRRRDMLTIFGPIVRYSNKAMQLMDREYRKKHGFYEMMVPTIAKSNGLKVADINDCHLFYTPLTLAGPEIVNKWTQEFINNSTNMLFHPVY